MTLKKFVLDMARTLDGLSIVCQVVDFNLLSSFEDRGFSVASWGGLTVASLG